MSQHYSNQDRATDPYSLPDLEIFRVRRGDKIEAPGGGYLACGWYWQTCLPGCMPDSDPFGPFKSETQALADARSQNDD